jgi:CHAT domain-containing protein/Tfp pilus assembly protein PilF
MTDDQPTGTGTADWFLAAATAAYLDGRSDLAGELLDVALAMPLSGAQRVSVLVQKASWLRESGSPEEGAKTLDDAARALEPLPRSGHEKQWSSLRMEQGMAAQQRGDFAAAETLLAEAETLARQSPEHDRQLTDVFANQAALYLHQGRLGEAQDVLLRALDIDRRAANKRGESNDLNMLGLVYESLGDMQASRAYLTKAFEVAEESGLTREALDAKTNLAALIDNTGDHAGAAELFKEIGQRRAEGGDESGVACAVANQGAAAANAGDTEAAVRFFTRSHELHLATGNLLHSVDDLINLSHAEEAQAHHDQAASYAEQALTDATRFGLIERLWMAEWTVAHAHVNLATLSDDTSGLIEAVEEALAHYSRAADMVELLRSRIDRPEEREFLLARKEELYDEAITWCLSLSRPRDAFRFCERARMRSFLDALGESRLQRLEMDDPGTERREQLVTRLLSPLTPANEKPGLMDELRAVRAEIIARRPALAAITEAQLPTEDDIWAAIPADTCVLEYFQADNKLVLFLLDRYGLKNCQLVVSSEPMANIIHQFLDEIEDGDTQLAAGKILFEALLDPVMPQLERTTKLIVVPHGSLHYIPFSALWYEPADDDGPPRQFLKNRFYLTTIPSASYLPYLARTARSDQAYGPAVVLGNPTSDLAGAETEARRVAAKLGVTARLRTEATRHALLGAGAPAVLHVACHGAYNPEDPLLSGLALADGAVTVEDLISAGPAPGLLVLSGCVTGRSDRRPGDELIGLAQAALRSGTRSVVATLWETFDDSSTLFFEELYKALKHGQSVSEAMAWAREAIATGDSGYDQPVDWAPFLLIGDPDQRIVEPDDAMIPAWKRGVKLWGNGDAEGAKAAFQQVAGSDDHEAAALAAFSLGSLLQKQADLQGAMKAYRQAADSDEPDAAPRALYTLGQLLEDQGDIVGARDAYQRAIDSDHPKAAPLAANNLGALLSEQHDTEGAQAAFQRAIDSNHTEAASKAANNLGILLARIGDTDGAREAYQRAIDIGDEDLAPMAALGLGALLSDNEDVPGAQAAYQIAIDSNHPNASPLAAYNLGTLLAEDDNVPGAQAAFQIAIDSNHPRARPLAAYNLGVMLAEQKDFRGALAAFRLAAASNDPEMARDAGNWIAELQHG